MPWQVDVCQGVKVLSPGIFGLLRTGTGYNTVGPGQEEGRSSRCQPADQVTAYDHSGLRSGVIQTQGNLVRYDA